MKEFNSDIFEQAEHNVNLKDYIDLLDKKENKFDTVTNYYLYLMIAISSIGGCALNYHFHQIDNSFPLLVMPLFAFFGGFSGAIFAFCTHYVFKLPFIFYKLNNKIKKLRNILEKVIEDRNFQIEYLFNIEYFSKVITMKNDTKTQEMQDALMSSHEELKNFFIENKYTDALNVIEQIYRNHLLISADKKIVDNKIEFESQYQAYCEKHGQHAGTSNKDLPTSEEELKEAQITHKLRSII